MSKENDNTEKDRYSRGPYTPILNRADTFIQRIHDGQFVISADARSIEFKGEDEAKKTNLAAELARCMYVYEDSNENASYASQLLIYIDMAFAYGVVIENTEAASQKAREYEKQVLSLKEQLRELRQKHDKLSDDYVFIQGKYDELKELFNRMVPKKKDDLLE